MLEINPQSKLNSQQSKLMVEIIKKNMLLIWNHEITDPINIFNQFLMFSEIKKIYQGFATCGGGIISVPLDFTVPPEYYHHAKLFKAIRHNKVTLVAFSDKEIYGDL